MQTPTGLGAPVPVPPAVPVPVQAPVHLPARARSRRTLLALLCALPSALGAGCTATPAEGAAGADAGPPAEITWVGGDTLPEQQRREAITEALAEFESRGRRPAAVDDASYALELLYRSEGFAFVTVDDELDRGTSTEAARITFTIDEGPRTWLREVDVEGNVVFSDDEVTELFRLSDDTLLVPGLGWYSRDDVRGAVAALAALYWSEGHLLAVIDEPVIRFAEDRSHVDVGITVHEGPAFRLRRVEITGELVFPEETLAEQLQDFLERPYFPQVAYAARARLLDFYGERGHAEATVEFEELLDETTGDVGLLYRVQAGPQLSVSAIRVEGLQRTRPEFLLARLNFEAGDTWSTAAQRQSADTLHRSGLFERVSIELQPGRETAREVAVEVKERVPQEAYIEPGWGSYEEARLTLGYRDRNVGGEGRIFHAEGSVSALAQSALVGITDPWFGRDLVADVSVFASHREEPSFTNGNLGVVGTLNKTLTVNWQTQFAYTFRRSTVSDVDSFTDEVLKLAENVNISSVSVSPIFDSRDDPFTPTTGSYWRTTLEYGGSALGGELNFVRGGYTHSWFTPLSASDVFGVSFRTGVIAPLAGSSVIPIQERYFNGGENTVRSFKEDELGPKDEDGDPIGGEAYSVFSAELRHTLTGRLGMAFFVDLGNVEEDVNEYFHFNNHGAAVGTGLRYLLPVGPVRLDFGVNPDPGPDDDDWAAHLSVGVPF